MSCRIEISPSGLAIDAKKGRNLLDILQEAGVPLEAECGGQGTCTACAVRLISGKCEWPGSALISPDDLAKGMVLSCQVNVIEPLIIEIPSHVKSSGAVVAVAGGKQDPLLTEFSPLSSKMILRFPETFSDDLPSDLERLFGEINTCHRLTCSLPVLQSLPGNLREKNGIVTATCTEPVPGEKRFFELQAGDHRNRHYGLACDIGTTTVAMNLVDLAEGRVIDTAAEYNGQIECGADVISRIIYSQKDRHLEDLQRRVLGTIDGLLAGLLSKNGVSRQEVTSAVFSGNTTMTHLFLGVDPKYIREEPYTPAVRFPPPLTAGEVKVGIHPEAPVLISPGVGSYVGGDITAGLLTVCRPGDFSGVDLFIDIGTNGELVMSGDGWRMGCACSAGPAFEGVGIRCGMRATTGAIESVAIDEDDGLFEFEVIGGGKPGGLCGSGLIELVAQLLLRGIISRDGRFVSDGDVTVDKNARVLTLVQADDTETGRDITISEHDIANIMRAKAAIFSACSLLLKKVGLTFANIERITIAGGFGRTIDVEKAVFLGLFPDISPAIFEYLGNTSLRGATLALLSRPQRELLNEIARSLTYVDLSSEPGYMNEYSGALFLPHTDGNLFPSVMRKLRE